MYLRDDECLTPKDRGDLHRHLRNYSVDPADSIRAAFNARKPLALLSSGAIVPATAADLWALYGSEELAAFMSPDRYVVIVKVHAPDALERFERRQLTGADGQRLHGEIERHLSLYAERW